MATERDIQAERAVAAVLEKREGIRFTVGALRRMGLPLVATERLEAARRRLENEGKIPGRAS